MRNITKVKRGHYMCVLIDDKVYDKFEEISDDYAYTNQDGSYKELKRKSEDEINKIYESIK